MTNENSSETSHSNGHGWFCVPCRMQMLAKQQGEPYDSCVDTSQRIHDFERNVYEELYPESFYNVMVSIHYLTVLIISSPPSVAA